MQLHLDEDVADARLAEGGVAVGPHDADGLAVHGRVVQRLQSPLGCMVRAHIDNKVRKPTSRASQRCVEAGASNLHQNYAPMLSAPPPHPPAVGSRELL